MKFAPPSGPRIEKWPKDAPPSEQEAEAFLRKEGYETYRWYDVPGATYPKHQHFHDECIWILQGEITFAIHGKDYALKAGDRIYLNARTAHTATVPAHAGVTYLVGEKK